MTKNASNHYVNNAEFLNALVEYRDACAEANKNGKEDPPIPNYIGSCFLQIAERLSRKPNFIMYSYRDEMISDGVENCLMYFRNFDPDKTSNPFAYFTQIIYYAFLRRIMREKKQTYVKYKATEQFGILDEFEMYEDVDGTMRQFQLYDNISEFIHNYEETKRKKKTVKKKGIENFIEDESLPNDA